MSNNENDPKKTIEEAIARRRAENIEDKLQDVLIELKLPHDVSALITSRYRTNSLAHRRGAIDLSFRNMRFSGENYKEKRKNALEFARLASEALGPHHRVIFEEVIADVEYHSTFQNGVEGRQRVKQLKRKATATHFHVQPNRSIELAEARLESASLRSEEIRLEREERERQQKEERERQRREKEKQKKDENEPEVILRLTKTTPEEPFDPIEALMIVIFLLLRIIASQKSYDGWPDHIDNNEDLAVYIQKKLKEFSANNPDFSEFLPDYCGTPEEFKKHFEKMLPESSRSRIDLVDKTDAPIAPDIRETETLIRSV